MKTRSKLRFGALVAIAAAALLVVQIKNPHLAPCVAQFSADSSLSAECQPQQSWFNWLQGNSRSTQFHFVDLLELLNRFSHSRN
ncbi:hypothetical protein [Rheinheimera sp.]|uniref:hypothetical protein n=1 Tax=Rheinheimera sp. TaxID=1869214 RepID=UPI00307FCB65